MKPIPHLYANSNLPSQIYRDVTNTLVADLTITNLTLTLRCMAALMYGTTIHNAREIFFERSLSTIDPVTKSQPNTFDLTGPNAAIRLKEIRRK